MEIFKEYIENTISQTDEYLPIIEEKLINEASCISKRLIPLVTQLVAAMNGGKKIRLGMTKLGYDLTGSCFNKDILLVGLAFDIFHSSILIHDDIIDESSLRRGKPTTHVVLGNNHYGISQAICLGDLGLIFSQNLIHQTNFSSKLKIEAIKYFNRTVQTTILGQMLDVLLPSQIDKTEDDLLSILKNKTAHYTICDPLCLGAILGGIDIQKLENLKIFGENIGIALQIKDDINGIFASSNFTGKPDHTDIEEGKFTYLSMHAYKNASLSQKEILDMNYGQGPKDENALNLVRTIFNELGSSKFAYTKLDEFIAKAKHQIKYLPDNYSSMLFSLSEYVYSYK